MQKWDWRRNLGTIFLPSSHSKDLNSLRCQEQRLTKLAEMIKNALNELGCEELPSGCDDLTVDQGFIDANGNVDQTVRQRLLFTRRSSLVLLVMGSLMNQF